MPPVDDDELLSPVVDGDFILSHAVNEVPASASTASKVQILDFIIAISSRGFVVHDSGNRCAHARGARTNRPAASRLPVGVGGRPRPHQETRAMPKPTPRTRKPPRAEPLQPDRPARGDETEQRPPDHDEETARERRHEQTDTALENVREGYR